MFRTIALSVALLVTACWPVTARQPELADVWNGAEIEWRDIKTGIYETAKSGKTAIMVFHAPWCSACKQYRSVFKDPGVVAASKNFVMILIDADADKMSNGAFSPDGTYVPRTLFLNADGDVLKQYVGADEKFPHSLNVADPAELRALMLRASAERSGKAGDAAAGPNEVKTSN